MAISRKYRSYGVRRANNLSDIDDREKALNNLLNDLQPREGESFVSEDLDAIRGLKDTEIFPSTFVQLASSVPTYTFANTLGPQEDFVRPFIRLQDKFNTYRSVTGDPGILGSGMGPSAWAVPIDAINSSPQKGDTANTIIFDFDNNRAGLVQKGDFWALGEFYQSYKFDPSFVDQSGGYAWEGYFIPNYYETSSTLVFETTGLFHFEVDRFDDGNWQVLRSIYSPTRTVKVGANTTTTTVQLATGDGKYVAIGDKLSTNNEIVVESVVGDVVTLTGDVSYVSNDDISFTFTVGEDYISGTFNTETIYDLGEYFKARVLWWYPNTAPNVEDKYFRIHFSGSDFLLFSTFSNTAPVPTSSDSNLLINTVDKAVTGYQRLFGDLGSYKTFSSGGILKSNYVPKSNFASVNILGSNTSVTASLTQGRSYITASLAQLDLTSIGNLIVDVTPSFNNIQKFTQIKRIPNNTGSSSVRVVSKPVLTTTSIPIKIVDHNGLMDYFITTTSGTTVPVETTENIRKGMVCVTYYTSPSAFTTITDVINSTSFSTSTPLGLTNNYLFVYADSGLIDSSKDVFCKGVVGKLLTSQATVGTDKLNVSSNTDLSINMRVQYTGGIEPENNVTIVAVGGNQVTLSSTLTATIDAGATITFAPQGSSGDKQQCVIPLDLSPPFTGVEYGLDTEGKRIVGVPSSNLDISTLSLSSNTAIVSSANTTDVFDAQITVNGMYRIKARQIP